MLARALRTAQLVELAACLGLGAWLHAAHGWGAGAIALGTLAWFAGIRLALVVLSSLLAWVHRTPRGPGEGIGLAATVRLVLGEWRSLLLTNLVYLPWENAVLRADPAPAPSDRVPVVLIHGYFANRGYFRPLARRLEALGIAPVFVPSSRALLSPIEVFAEELHGHIERIVAATGQPRVVLVGHSMGGLIARAYIARHGSRRVARLVTLGSPHHGTALARLGSGANAREMEPGSAFLERLGRDASARDIETLSIYSRHDNMVFPQASSRLEGARAMAVSGVGHIDLLRSRPVFEALVSELRAAGAAPGA